MTSMTEERLPLDWDEWQQEWRAWRAQHPEIEAVRKQIPGQNFLADEIIGTFRLPSGRVVELSEVTFPNLEERDPDTGRLLDYRVRSIGLTFVDTRDGRVVASFAELEHELGL